MFADSAYEPQAVPERIDRKTSDGEAQMGYGIQGLLGVSGWVHEPSGTSSVCDALICSYVIDTLL
jgi:hypothetical protein